jgi:hypothetical protein
MDDRMALTDVSADEALARVTYQIIRGDYSLHPELYETPTLRLLELANLWAEPEYHFLAEQLLLAAIWCANGGTVATWLRSRIVFRARALGQRHRAS